MCIINSSDVTKNDVLEYLENCDSIDITHIQTIIMENKRKKYLDMHPYNIWERDGTFYTYLRDSKKPKGRRQIQRKDLANLEDEIIKNVDEYESIKISDLFEEYISRKERNDNIRPATVHRYRTIFKRHYESTGWAKKDIRKVSLDEYADFIEDEIGRNSLDAKALSNFKGITTGILKRAAKRHLVEYTYTMVYDFVDSRPKKKRKDASKEIVTEIELRAFIQYIKENRDVMNLALLFIAVSGLRVGEMVALKFSDFISDTSFNVCRTETFYKDSDGNMIYEVEEDAKTDAGHRVAYIPKQYAWIVKEMRRLNPFAEYLCTDSMGNRIRAYRLRSRIYYICKKLPEFSQMKSPHKLRKTFCSILLDQGFDNNFIISVMGHTDISVSENFYHFDRKTSSQKQDMLDSVTEFKVI